MDGYYIGRTNTLSFIASRFAKRESLPKSERIRRSEADAGASLDIYNSERHYDRIIKIYQRRMP